MRTQLSRALVRGGPRGTPTAGARDRIDSLRVKSSRYSRSLVAIVTVVTLSALGNTAARGQFITLAPGGASGYPSDLVFGPIFNPPSPVVPPVAFPVFPPAGFGPTVVLVPSPPPLPAMPPGTYFVDALTSGNEAGNTYLFSVAAGSMGLPGSQVMMEAVLGTAPSQALPPGIPGPGVPMEQMGDIFRSPTNFVTGAPHPMFGVAAAGGPLMAAAAYRDEFTLGLNVGDDLAGLQIRMPMGGPAMTKYSIGAAGAVPPPYAPADIISAALPFGLPWAAAGALGLGPADDIDALITQDLAAPPIYMPGVDLVAFSLAPGSPTLAAIGAGPGDLLMAMPFGPPVVFIPGMALGLGPMDNLDAIDVVVSQPGDYTGDGRVDAADYIVWRNALGMPAIPPGSGADGSGNGFVGISDYAIWRTNFGLPPGTGTGAAVSGTTVPEPCVASLLLTAIFAGLGIVPVRSGRRQDVNEA